MSAFDHEYQPDFSYSWNPCKQCGFARNHQWHNEEEELENSTPKYHASAGQSATGVQPGDILAIRSDGFAGRMIRFGSALIDEPNLANHIAVLDHQDAKGTWWCLEGRPGGVGWRDATAYLASSYTIANRNQPKSDAQRAAITGMMRMLINTQYDWDAIVGDALRDLHLPPIPDPWAEKTKNGGEVAGHVVCSSAAVFAYIKAIVGHPEQTDAAHIEPSDWVQFIIENHYE